MKVKTLIFFLFLTSSTISAFCQDATDIEHFFEGAEDFASFAADVMEDRLLDGLTGEQSGRARLNSLIKGQVKNIARQWLIGDTPSEGMNAILNEIYEDIRIRKRQRINLNVIVADVPRFQLRECWSGAASMAEWTARQTIHHRLLKGMMGTAFDLVASGILGAPNLVRRLVEAPTRAAYDELRRQLENELKEELAKDGRETYTWETTSNVPGTDTGVPLSIFVTWNKQSGKYLYRITGDVGCQSVRIPGTRHAAVDLNSFQVIGGGEVDVKLDHRFGSSQEPRAAVYHVNNQFFRMVLECECRDEEELRAIRRAEAEFIPPKKAEPDQTVVIEIEARDHRNWQIEIHDVEVDGEGLIEIMEEGAQPAYFGIPGRNPRVEFKIADPRRNKTFEPINITLTDGDGNILILQESYEVANVKPKIEEMTPNSTAADPGAEMSLTDVQMIASDGNADLPNEHELHTSEISFSGQPDGLSTDPKFTSFKELTREQFDSNSGTYRFQFSQSGVINKPHAHGRFSNQVIVRDRDRETDMAEVTYRVNNVAPVVERTLISPRKHLDSGRPIPITFQATIRDDNGWDDIRYIEVDATEAGAQRVFTLALNPDTPNESNGLEVVNREESRLEIRTDAFVHTEVPGYHNISIEVRDGPDGDENCNMVDRPDGVSVDGFCNSIKVADRIHVGNLPPEIGIYGMVWDSPRTSLQEYEDLIFRTGDDGQLHVGGSDRLYLCPGQYFDVAVTAFDPENHPFIVTASLNDQQVELDVIATNEQIGQNDLHNRGMIVYTLMGFMLAPSEPGEYTVEIVVQETVHDKQKGEAKILELIVDPCDEDEPETTPDPEEEPVTEPEPETGITDDTTDRTEDVSFTDRLSSFDFSSLSGRTGVKLDWATRGRFEDAVCDQMGLMECEADNLTPVYVLFAELDFAVDVAPERIEGITAGVGTLLSRSSVDFQQDFSYGAISPGPYQIYGQTNITTLELYGRAGLEFSPMMDWPLSPYFTPYLRFGFAHIWNNGEFDFMSPDENFSFNREHRGIHYTGGIGTDIGFSGSSFGTRFNLDYLGGGADANLRFGLGLNYSF